jgi:hypothetical protein
MDSNEMPVVATDVGKERMERDLGDVARIVPHGFEVLNKIPIGYSVLFAQTERENVTFYSLQ